MLSSRLARLSACTAGLLVVLGALATTAPDSNASALDCDGGEEIRLEDGAVVGCTHGADLPPPGVNVSDGRTDAQIQSDIEQAQIAAFGKADGLSPAGIACVGDGNTGHRVQAIYAVPADRPNRAGTVVPAIQTSYAPRVESQFIRSAAETGGEAHVAWVTTPSGASCQLDVRTHVLSPSADDSFSAMVSELRALGYTRSDRKYLVWLDSNVLCGVGAIFTDSRPDQGNANNGVAPMFARVDSACWGYAEGHELMHTLGGVQRDAPNATPSGHCTDERDEMCYDDDGSGPVQTRTVCGSRDGKLFDCNHDDYFYAGNPPAGSWLASHWNTYNSRFLHRGALSGGTPPPGNTTTTTTPPQPAAGLTVSAGGDQTAAVGRRVVLDGNATGTSGSRVLATWSGRGPRRITFINRRSLDTSVVFSAPGTYTLTLRVSDGTSTRTDTVTVSVNAAGLRRR